MDMGTESDLMHHLIIPFPPSILRPNDRSHWRVKNPIKIKYKNDCYALAMASQVKPAMPEMIVNPNVRWDWDVKPKFKNKLSIDLEFNPPNNRWDWDACISAAKAGFDAVAMAWGIDDRYFRPRLLTWNQADVNNPHIKIFFE